MGTKIRLVEQTDWSGGVNAVTSPFLLTRKQALRVRNMILDEHGALSTRDGYTPLSVSPDVTSPIVYRNVLNTTAGVSYPFAVQASGSNTLRRTDTTPWTLVGGTFTNYVTPQSVTINDTELFAMGYETPWQWNGTTFSQITAQAGQTVPLGAKHIAFHLGSVWLWNTNAVTTTLDGPSSLRMSDPNNQNSWPNANQTFIAKDDGQQGMGLATYTIVETGISPTSTLIAFKNSSAYQITGVFGASNFTVQKVKSDMGCVAPRTIQFCSGFGVIRLTHKGFALYNGVDDKLVSEEIRPYIFGHDDITALNFSAIDRAYAVQSQNPPLYIAACPVTSTGLDRVFVYDLIRRAWTICDFPITLQTLSLFTTPTAQPIVHGGTATGGQLVTLFNRATTDNGVPIAWSVRTRWFFLGSFMRPTFWRRAILDFEVRPSTAIPATYGTAVYGTSQYSGTALRTAQPVTVTTTLGGVAALLSTTATFTPLTSAGSLYGSALYGQAVYGSGFNAVTDARQTVEMNRVAPSVFLDISGTGFVRLRGLSLHAVERRPTGVFA